LRPDFYFDNLDKKGYRQKPIFDPIQDDDDEVKFVKKKDDRSKSYVQKIGDEIYSVIRKKKERCGCIDEDGFCQSSLEVLLNFKITNI